MKALIIISMLVTSSAFASYDAEMVAREFTKIKSEQGVEVSNVMVSNPENPLAHLGEWHTQVKVDYDHEIVEITFNAFDTNIDKDVKYGCLAGVNDNKLGVISLCRPLVDVSPSWFSF